jgi:carboxynorspermidine decarboxylase
MGKAQAGIRINPEYSTVATDLYNPCTPGSRLGVRASDLAMLPKGITGLHAHNLCEGGAKELTGTLENIERLFGHLLPDISWLNLGGGHLITKKGYNIELLQQTLRAFHARYPHIEIILEPGAAFVWETGFLVATVLDIVENQGVTTAMLDTSFATHMPDCLEMPYTPRVHGAVVADGISTEPSSHRIRLGGASCLAGDWVGDYLFPAPLKIGDRVVFEDMMHYTMVKTTTFNGIALADIGIYNGSGYELVKRFSYEDYRSRLS